MVFYKTILFTLGLTSHKVIASLGVFNDIYANPKYEVNFIHDDFYTKNEALLALSTNTNVTYELLKSSKSGYLCQIDQVSADLTDYKKESDELHSKISSIKQALKDGLEGKCALLVDGYWTYSLCNNTQVSQFHGGVNILSNPRSFRYILGNDQSDSTYRFGRDHMSWYVSKTFVNGTICDINGIPRTVEVQYSCNPSEANTNLFSMKEQKTCNYIARVSVPELCEEALFRSRIDPFVREIKCHKVIDLDERVCNKEDYRLDQFETSYPTKISLMKYELHSLGNELFSGFPKADDDDLTIIIDLESDPDSLVERFGGVYFRSLNQFKLVAPNISTILQEQAIGYFFDAHVYDHKGDYEATLEIAFERQDPPVITITMPTNLSPFSANIRNMMTLKEVIHKAMYEGKND